MDLESRDFFTDPVFNLSKKDYTILSRSYFTHHSGDVKGWYAPEVTELAKQDSSKWEILKDNDFIVNGEIDFPTYRINDLGFRCSTDWSSGKKGAIFLGCSDLFGIGNHLKDTAAEIVSKELGVENYNLSIPGGGLDQAYRVLKYHIKDINAEFVFLFITEPSRREYFTDKTSVLVSPASFNKYSTTRKQLGDYFSADKLEDLYFKLQCEPKYLFMETNKSLDAIKYVCKENNLKLITVKNPVYYTNKESIDLKLNTQKGVYGKRYDLGCDLVHRGKVFQKEVAKYFMKKL